jgi:hypothetical protein
VGQTPKGWGLFAGIDWGREPDRIQRILFLGCQISGPALHHKIRIQITAQKKR